MPLAPQAIYTAIKSQPDTFEKDMGDGKGPMLVMEVDEEDWELGYDAVDGGSTASVAAVLTPPTHPPLPPHARPAAATPAPRSLVCLI